MADAPLTIGAFSRATGLSAKALRSYDRLGLLSPARVDPDTRYRWYVPGTAAQLARGENQCARVYVALGRAEPALHHANRCLDLVGAGGEGFEDWDLASALEVAARANLVAESTSEAARYAELARQELETTTDPDDREVIESQLAELGV